MKNPYQPKIAIIKKIQVQTPEVKLFTLGFENKKDSLELIPGQFIEVGIPNFGEAPFAAYLNPRGSNFQICIRQAGALTSRLHKAKIGDLVTIRGPYGNGFPQIKNKNLLLIGGGLGIIPLRPLIVSTAKEKTTKTQVFYGARCYNELLFKNEFKQWKKFVDLSVTLDVKDKCWSGYVGLITALFDKTKIINNAVAIVCGPPIMYKFVLQKLKQANFSDTDIFLSLERRMHCGVGTCQHCTIGSYYVCKHGPIFNWQDIKKIPNVI